MTSPYPDRWPVQHPDRLQAYLFPTPNGQKLGVMLEELGLPYEAHTVHIGQGEQHDEGYLRINPNGKIPTLVDPDGPDGEPFVVFESGAILLYLARKTGRFLPASPRLREETLQWLFFQMGGIGPFLGQFNHFYKLRRENEYGVERYTKEGRRLLQVLDRRLEGRTWLMGEEYTIADIATAPWLNSLDWSEGKGPLGYQDLAHVPAWVERFNARPAVQRGSTVGAPA